MCSFDRADQILRCPDATHLEEGVHRPTGSGGGSSGTIDIDVKKRRGQLEHEARYTEYTSDSVAFS